MILAAFIFGSLTGLLIASILASSKISDYEMRIAELEQKITALTNRLRKRYETTTKHN